MTQASDLNNEPMPQYRKVVPMGGGFNDHLAGFIELALYDATAAKAALEVMDDDLLTRSCRDVLDIVAACKANPAAFEFKAFENSTDLAHASTKDASLSHPTVLEYLDPLSFPLFQSHLKTLVAPNAGIEPFAEGVSE